MGDLKSVVANAKAQGGKWQKPEVVNAKKGKGKICKCSDDYKWDSRPSFARVCDDGGFIEECDAC